MFNKAWRRSLTTCICSLRLKLKQMKNIKIILAAFVSLFALVSCSKWDDYKKYTEEGETLYTGKLDSVKVFTGNQRVKITGLFTADPNVAKTKITWNDGRDSVIFNITKGTGIDSFNKIINVPEGVLNFKIQNFDAKGNGSMIVFATGVVLGPKYISGLGNRPVKRAELLSSGIAEVEWDSFDTTTGAKLSVVKYTRTDNSVDSVIAPVAQAKTNLPNFKGGTSVTIRTLYVPSATAIDSFFCGAQTVGVMYDVTAQYLKNTGTGVNGTNFSTIGTDGRWRIPTDWIVTPDVKNNFNMTVGGVDLGGWLPFQCALSMESWDAGQPLIPNGKIYQTVTLPAGKFTLVVTTSDCSDRGTKYITIASGNTLPDIGNVLTTALAYKSISKWTDNVVKFDLANATEVSIGFQAKFTEFQSFLKINKVKLYYTP